MKKINIIFGAGHGSRVLTDFIGALLKNEIEMLVDARTFPMSRHVPQFNKNNLSKVLPSVGIKYQHEGKRIGGRSANVDFDGCVDELVEMAKRGMKICLMCMEKNPEACHRATTLKPALAKRGVELVELKFPEK